MCTGFSRQRDAAGARAESRVIRMRALVLDHLRSLAVVRLHPEDVSVGEVDQALVGAAVSGRHLDDVVEDRLKPKAGLAQRAQDVGDRLVTALNIGVGQRQVS
jgi:hypothetical protein